MRMPNPFVAFLFLLTTINGCCSLHQPSKPELVPVSDTINLIKDELNEFYSTKPTVKPNKGVCYTGNEPYVLAPKKVSVTLKTVTTRGNEPSAGISAPIGVIKFDPSYSGSYSNGRTQTLQIPLEIGPRTEGDMATHGDHVLAKAISAFRDELLKVDHTKTPCLKFIDEKNPFKLSLAFDVVNKTTGGFGFQLAVVKVSDQLTAIDEAHQTLDIEFVLDPGQMIAQ
jgi:hypothetical protein